MERSSEPSFEVCGQSCKFHSVNSFEVGQLQKQHYASSNENPKRDLKSNLKPRVNEITDLTGSGTLERYKGKGEKEGFQGTLPQIYR